MLWLTINQSILDEGWHFNFPQRGHYHFRGTGTEIEIILMKGYEAKVDRKILEYLITHPGLLKEYEQLKYQYCSSKKEYMIQKDKFFRKVIKMIPHD